MTDVPPKPGSYAGIINPLTQYLRGELPLTEAERKQARFLRFERRWDFPEIAEAIGRTEAEVRHSLANARTQRVKPPRFALNVGEAAYNRVLEKQMPGEPVWVTMNRLLEV